MDMDRQRPTGSLQLSIRIALMGILLNLIGCMPTKPPAVPDSNMAMTGAAAGLAAGAVVGAVLAERPVLARGVVVHDTNASSGSLYPRRTYSVALVNNTGLSLSKPIPLLQAAHSNPRTFSVSWQWSTNNLEVLLLDTLLLQIAQHPF